MAATAKSKLAEEQFYLNIHKAYEALSVRFMLLFKENGLTSFTQYNVLRILRGAGEEGLSCQNIGQRLVSRIPDVTRLLDRMVKLGLVDRMHSTKDRRVVLVKLTPAGIDLVNKMDAPVNELHRQQFNCLSEAEITAGNEMMVKILDHLINENSNHLNQKPIT